MLLISDTDLHKARRVVMHRLHHENKRWSFLFGGQEDFYQWVMSVANEGVAIALDDSENFDPTRGDLIHWFYLKARKVAFREIRQEMRFRKSQKSVAEATLPPEEDVFAHFLLSDELVDILTEITEEQKQALALVYLIGFNHAQAAQILKKQRNAIDALIFRAKKKSREVYCRKMAGSVPSRPLSTTKRGLPQPRSSLSSDPEGPNGRETQQLGEAIDG